MAKNIVSSKIVYVVLSKKYKAFVINKDKFIKSKVD